MFKEPTSLETPLPGGLINSVVQIGATVRRPMPPCARYVHALLRFLADRDWPGAPRFLGVDEQGREILSFVKGDVPWRPADRARVRGDDSLRQVTALLREFHDLTAGTPLAGDEEVACHNDLSPRNTVYRGTRPVAFLDWDFAAPGARIHDVAYLCWQFLNLGIDSTDPVEAGRQIALIRSAYGLASDTPLAGTILWWQQRSADGILRGASAGDQALIALRDSGVPESIRAAAFWVAQHRSILDGVAL